MRDGKGNCRVWAQMHVKVESSGVNTSWDNRTTGRRWDDVMMEWMSPEGGRVLSLLAKGGVFFWAAHVLHCRSLLRILRRGAE